MKFAAMIEYGPDQAAIKTIFPDHRKYLQALLESGELFAAGPLAFHKGALWVFEAETMARAEKIVSDDPFHAAGVFAGWHIYPLAYWSAKEAKGS